MPDDLYHRDALLWSERQAELLRRLQAGERLNEAVDWPNVIEEILAMGRSDLHACEALITQLLAHVLKLLAAPTWPSASPWRAEAAAFLIGARRRWSPSMAQRVDLAQLYADARELAQAGLADVPDTGPLPAECPVTLDDVIGRGATVAALLATFTGVPHAG